MWEILKVEGIDPAPDRSTSTWADFLRGQAQALLAVDFIETITLTGQRQYILAVIEHATRRVRVLGTTAHPTAVWVTQAARNLVMDLDEAGAQVRYLIRDRDAKFQSRFDRILNDAGIDVVLSGVRVPLMNSIMERWVRTCRRELLDRTLIWNENHLRHCLREFELHYNQHRPHQAMRQAAPLRAVPAPITDPDRLTRLDIRRRDRLGGIIHECQRASRPAQRYTGSGVRAEASWSQHPGIGTMGHAPAPSRSCRPSMVSKSIAAPRPSSITTTAPPSHHHRHASLAVA